MIYKTLLSILLATAVANAPAFAQQVPPIQDSFDHRMRLADAAFEKWMADNHIPGLVWGVVKDGRLVHVKAMGVQDLGDTRSPVTDDTGFRIASMSKAFTGYAILKLRDEGKLRLDDPAWKYLPEIKSWAKDVGTSVCAVDDLCIDDTRCVPRADVDACAGTDTGAACVTAGIAGRCTDHGALRVCDPGALRRRCGRPRDQRGLRRQRDGHRRLHGSELRPRPSDVLDHVPPRHGNLQKHLAGTSCSTSPCSSSRPTARRLCTVASTPRGSKHTAAATTSASTPSRN